MLTSEQKKKREAILGIAGTKYPNGGMEKFGGLSLARFKRLVSEGFISVRDQETYKRFMGFMEKNSIFRAFGYAVSDERSDSRVVIQGIEAVILNKLSQVSEKEFQETFSDADEVNTRFNRFNCLYNYENKVNQ